MSALAASLGVLLCVAADGGAADAPSGTPVSLTIAVLPLENLTGGKAPTRELTRKVEAALALPGIAVVEAAKVERFLTERRLRQTSGVDRESARTAADSLGVDALLVTMLTHYRASDPPRVGLSMRLVRADDDAAILWADGASSSGDEAPGLLDLGRVNSVEVVEARVLERLGRSLHAFATGGEPVSAQDCRGGSVFGARVQYRSPLLDTTAPRSLAVVPFLNGTRQRRAGELVAAEFVRELSMRGPFRVIEPGVVRDLLLRFRMVIPGGVNLEATRELLGALEADLVLSGTVLEYEEQGAEGPRVRFATTLLDAHTGKVLFQSTSVSQGTDGVVLFDLGQVRNVGELTCRMVSSVTRGLAAPGPDAARTRSERWRVVRSDQPQPARVSPEAACSVSLPPAAMAVEPAAVEPPITSRRPGHVGEPLVPIRAVQIRFDPKTGAILPADEQALVLLARCARAQNSDLAVRALVAPTPDQLIDGARRTVDALHSVEGLRRERIRLEVLTESDRRGPVEVLVAAVEGPGSTPAPAPAAARAPEPEQGASPEPAADAGVSLTSAEVQAREAELNRRTAALQEQVGALEDKARRLLELEKELAGASGKLVVVGEEERALKQAEDRQVEVETRLKAIQATLLANEARRKQDEQAAISALAKLQREGAEAAVRRAGDDRVRAAKARRLEAFEDRVALQEKLVAAVEKRLEAQERRLERAGAAGPAKLPGDLGKRQLAETIAATRPEVRRCVASALKQLGAPDRATGAASLTIDGRGRVEQLIAPPAWRSTSLSSCLGEAASGWRFPSSGAEYQVQVLLNE